MKCDTSTFEIKGPADKPYTLMSEEEILTKLKKSREQGKFTDADDVISGMRAKYGI